MAESRVTWQEAPSELTRRVVFMGIYGGTGTGRTSLALTAPGPIALLHASEKLEGIVQVPKAAGKVVKLYDFGATFEGGTTEVTKQAERVLDGVLAAWEDAKTWARTIVIDTDTDLWELLRLTRFGKVTQIKPHHYTQVNAEWRNWFHYFRQQESHNLILLSKMKEEYVNEKGTGRMVPSGMKETPYMQDVRVRTDADMRTGRFWSTVEKPWWNSPLMGMEFDGEMSRFATIMGMLTETAEGEWA